MIKYTKPIATTLEMSTLTAIQVSAVHSPLNLNSVSEQLLLIVI